MHGRTFIEVTYKLRSSISLDAAKKAQSIALGQTTDTWTPNSRSGLQKLKKHEGKVLAVTTVSTAPPAYEYLMKIGYPTENTENDISTLLTMVFGKISMDGQIRLEDITFPPFLFKAEGAALRD